MIAIIDYGMGNLRSVHKAFEAVGAEARITHNVADILNADKVVLPGVGAMGPAMQKLQELGLAGPIRKVISEGKPFLGICLGLQLLFESSSEGGFSQGLRILKGSVERFTSLKVPHMGWNQINFSAANPLFKGLASGTDVYFCHSYYVKPAERGITSAMTGYGGDFVSTIQKDNLWGVQFHPEKSQKAGLQILKNFWRFMILIPAIDIKDGQVVRLYQGDFDKQTGYDPYPLMAAKRWHDKGAQWLHLVDLDGAKDGAMGNKEHVIYITQKIGIPVQVGGGIRDPQTVEDLIKAGVKRVVLGTKAIQDHKFLKSMLDLWGEQICVSLDCSNGFVAESGWVTVTNIKATDLALEFQGLGLKWLVYTDIARDGALTGPNYEQVQTMLNTVKKINLIASGGIATIDDVRKLAAMKGVAAAITGKAIYEGKLDFEEAVKILNVK